MGCKCCGTKSREEEEGERKTSCLRCCAPRKKKNNKGRRNWNPFTCLKCRGKKITCCSSSCCSNKPSETGNGNEKNKSSAELKESRQNIPHDEKKKRKFRRGSCLPCLVCGGESGCCGRLRGCCGWKQGCCAKSTEDNNIKSIEDGNNITSTDVNSNIKSSAQNNIRSSDVNIRSSAENNIRPFDVNMNIRPSTENNIRLSDIRPSVENNIKPSENNIRPSDVNIRPSAESNNRPSDVKNIKPSAENNIKPSDANNNSKPSDARKEEEKRKCLTCFACKGSKPLNARKEGEKKNCLTCFACKGSKPLDARKEGEKRNCLTCFACKGKMLRSCFCCAKSSEENKKSSRKKEPRKGSQLAFLVHSISFKSDGSKHRTAAEEILRIGNGNIAARVFQFRELAAATKNFRAECLLGEGGFGRVYQGKLEDTNQIVAVKQLDRNGFQGNREFLVEVLMLSLLHHPNLVKLLGYCADGDQRILVYEYMPLGSLEDLLAPSPNRKPLDWNTRMKIALGSAKGLEYLHDIANPPVIYRDFKTSNILLDDEYNPKLSDFGLAKLGPIGDKNYVSTRVMGTYGYCAPEYALTGQLTKMSDIYSFGVVFLEIITGRKAIDITKPTAEQQLVHWAGPLFKDKTKFVEMADPLLQGKYPLKGLYQALAVASMCLQDEANIRPRISDVVTALEYLAIPSGDPNVGLKESTPIEVATPISALETNTDGIEEMNDKENTLQTQSNREDEIQMEVDITS